MLNFPFMFKETVCCYCIIAYVYSKPRSCGSQQQDRVSILASFGSQSLTGDQVSQPVSSPTQFYVLTNQHRATDCQPVSQRPLMLCIISVNQGQTHVSFSVVAVLLCHCESRSLIQAKHTLCIQTTVQQHRSDICMSPSYTLNLSGEWLLMILHFVEHDK